MLPLLLFSEVMWVSCNCVAGLIVFVFNMHKFTEHIEFVWIPTTPLVMGRPAIVPSCSRFELHSKFFVFTEHIKSTTLFVTGPPFHQCRRFSAYI